MLGLFKKQPKDVIEKIHNEFYTASDKILSEAKKILEGVRLEKSERLENVGFSNCKEAAANKNIKITAETSSQITYYQTAYPLNKFILKSSVVAICKKYNLLLSDISNFTGFVPEKNLSEIENFKVWPKDVRRYTIIKSIKYACSYTDKRGISDIKKYLKELDWEIPDNIKDLHRHLSKDIGSRGMGGYTSIDSIDTASPIGLLICASIKDFKTDGLSKTGTSLFKFTRTVYPDPVVLQPVKRGYLIVTAWGDESSDELVANPIHN